MLAVDIYERRRLKAFQLNVIYVADRWLDVILVNKALRARHDSYKCCLIVVRRAQRADLCQEVDNFSCT